MRAGYGWISSLVQILFGYVLGQSIGLLAFNAENILYWLARLAELAFAMFHCHFNFADEIIINHIKRSTEL